MMNICLDVRYTTRSGASTVIEAFLENLPEKIREVSIDVVTHRDQHRNRPRVKVPFRNRLLEFQWSQTVLAQTLAERRYDIYHSLKHVGPIRCPIRSIYRVPAVGQFVGQYPQKMMDQIYWGRAAKHVYRKADALIAVSEYVRRGLIEYLNVPAKRVRTIHNGVDPRFRAIPQDKDDVNRLRRCGIDRSFLLCVANVLPVKNLITAVKAFQRLADDGLQLVIAGNDLTAEADRIRKLTDTLGISERVLFLGRQNPEQLLMLYNRAQMLLHPSFHEGLSSTLLEAMACGLPIVAANTTSIPETTKDAAVYHDATDVDQLVFEIQRVLGDQDLQRRMSGNGIARAADFSWQKCVEQTLKLYGELGTS